VQLRILLEYVANIFLYGLDLMRENLDSGEEVRAINQVLVLLGKSASQLCRVSLDLLP
jgi:hypothetical protein